MPVAILAHATNTDTDTGSYLERAARAGRACLAAAGVGPEEIGALINAGIFRDSNIVEPAIAALIQERLEITLAYAPGAVPTIAFDVLNGGCGLLDALSIAESFFDTSDLVYALLVAGDTHPSTALDTPDFPFTASAAALLLGRVEQGGIGPLHTAWAPGALEPYATVPMADVGTEGRKTLRVGDIPDPLDHAVSAVRQCMAAEGLDLDEVLLLAPGPTADFADRLAAALGVNRAVVIGLPAEVGDPHSAAPAFAYARAMELGVLHADRVALLIAADGPVASCLSYRPLAAAISGGN